MRKSSTAHMLKALDVDLKQVALKSAMQRELLMQPPRPGQYANVNAGAEDAQRVQNHNGPTVQIGDARLQGGVISADPTITSIQQTTGQGYTGGWAGPSTNNLGIMDKGNFEGQLDAGIPNQDLEKGLYVLMYSRYAASRKAASELEEEVRRDVYGQQTTAEAGSDDKPTPRSMVPGAA